MKKMQRQLKLMLLANAVFVVMYLFFDWLEYLGLNHQYVQTYFPWGIQSQPLESGPAVIVNIMPNVTLLIFLIAIFANTYFLIIIHVTRKLEVGTYQVP